MLNYKPLFLISVILYVLFLVYGVRRRIPIINLLLYSVFYFYLNAVIYVTLFPIPIDSRLIQDRLSAGYEVPHNFTPFSTITDLISNYLDSSISFSMIFKQVAGNILLLLPLGFYLPLFFHKKPQWYKISMYGFLASISIEAMQFMISTLIGFQYRAIDIDDIILNTVGTTIGFFLFRLLYPFFQNLFHETYRSGKTGNSI